MVKLYVRSDEPDKHIQTFHPIVAEDILLKYKWNIL